MTCLVFLTAWFEIIACLLCILLYLCDVAFELLLQLVQQYLFIPRSVTAFPSVPKIHAFLLYLKLENSLPEPKLPKLLETPADLHVFCYSFVVQTFCVFFFLSKYFISAYNYAYKRSNFVCCFLGFCLYICV